MRTLPFLFSLLLAANCVCGELTIADNGYEGVIVTISPDVQEDQGIIDGIKDWISSGSESLYTATDRQAYIHSVRILIPATWLTVQAELTAEVSLEDGHIRVQDANPLYGEGPYTIQTGGCASPGEAIYTTPNYFTELSAMSTEVFGPPGHIFVHEWSKFRYGVFDEYGYPGDNLYPSFYMNPRDASELLPNFCTIKPIQGYSQDLTTGGACTFNEITGLPDENCIFIPTGDNSFADTSILATPFLESTEYYCNTAEELKLHNMDLPNKQNTLCNQQSTWDVVMQSPDMNLGFGAWETAPDTIFEILRPDEGKFVLVLDKSGSMLDEDRIDYLRQSVMRWIQHDIDDGSELGIVQFSNEPKELQEMTVVTDQNRDDMMDVVEDIEPKGGTCLGAAVKAGVETMAETGPGGVMIFFTDGEHDCDEDDDSTVDSPEVVEAVLNQKIRVITIAIGPNADKGIEYLSDISGGKAYFIPDNSGLGNINDALQASLTYQPAVATEDMEFVIFKQDYEKKEDITGKFLIDATIGRDVELQMDYVAKDSDPIDQIIFHFPDGTDHEEDVSEDRSNVYIVKYASLDAGEYTFTAVFRNRKEKEVDSAFVIVKSKAKEDTLPITTSCWFSTADGSNSADLSNGDPLAVVAEVMQGQRPVMNAVVRALIEKEGETNAIEQFLYDNGSGPDLVANDGLYSRYFTTFDGNTRYLLRCQVESTEQTAINGGFITTREAELSPGQTYSYPLQGAIPCCGSDAFTGNSVTPELTGMFGREAVGGSIRIDKGPSNQDNIPPSSPRDFKVTKTDTEGIIEATFTAPGDDFDDGTADKYELFFTPDYLILSTGDYLNASNIINGDLVEGSLDPVVALTPVTIKFNENILVNADTGELDDSYFFKMRFTDESGNVAVSNMVSITFVQAELPPPEKTPEPSTPEPTTPEPLPTTTEPEPTTTEPEPTTTEPLPTTPEPLTTTTDAIVPLLTTTESEPTTTEPVVVSVMSTTEAPIEETTTLEPVTEPTKPDPTTPESTTVPALPSSAMINSFSCIAIIALSIMHIFNNVN